MQKNDQVALPLAQLSNPCVLNSLMDRFSDLYPGCNRAAIVSQWSMSYFTVLIRDAVGPALIAETATDIFESQFEMLLESAEPVALNVSAQAHHSVLDQQLEFTQRLIHLYVEPIVLALAKIGGIAPKVLWNNVIVVWDICYQHLRSSFPHYKQVESMQLHLQEMNVSNGKIQLRRLLKRVESPAPELLLQIPVRTHCCLHYQLHVTVAGQFPVWCESCPKLHCRPLEEQACYLRQLHSENMEGET